MEGGDFSVSLVTKDTVVARRILEWTYGKRILEIEGIVHL